jgi:cytochrome P450
MKSFNPMDPEFLADPYPTYHRLRAEDPVHYSPLGFWVLTRYEDVAAVLRDARFIKEPLAALVAARFGSEVPRGVGLSMLDRDPPDHTRLRSLVSKAFTPRVVEGLRPRIQEIVDGLIARAEAAGSMDLIEEFAYPIPVNVICEMMGVPVQDHERFKGWSLDIARGLDSIWLPPIRRSRAGAPPPATRSATTSASSLPSAALSPRGVSVGSHRRRRGQAQRRGAAGDVHPDPHRRPRDHGEPDRQRGPGASAQPRRAAPPARDPRLITTAVEELLRYDGPVQRTARVASDDATIGGHTIRKGEMVMPFIGAADRDPAHFPEPDRLDPLARRQSAHRLRLGDPLLPGAPLARVEGQIAINTLCGGCRGSRSSATPWSIVRASRSED